MAAEGSASTGGTKIDDDHKKRFKSKGNPHGLHYEILNDPNIIAESGWEDEDEEFWSYKLCKKYVKMYHFL